MKSLTLLIKPSSSKCQLRCRYCFYMEESRNRGTSDYGFMTEDTMDAVIQRSLDHFHESCDITFMFQGGEPTLIGLPWYETFITKVQKYRKDYHHIHFAIQTNGILLDDRWFTFLKEHHFLVGISLDGYRKNHDSVRITAGNDKTYMEVLQAYRKCIQYGIDVNVLTVLTEKLSTHADEYHDFLVRNDISWVQLIPCLDEGIRTPYTLTPKGYETFFIRLFDLWYQEFRKGTQRSIGLFDDILNMFQGNMPGQCGRLGRCSYQYVVEADGSVFPCDFYCTDQWLLGNLISSTLQQVTDTPVRQKFLNRVAEPVQCRWCIYRNMCHGGCTRQRSCYYTDSYCAHQKLLRHIHKVISGR